MSDIVKLDSVENVRGTIKIEQIGVDKAYKILAGIRGAASKAVHSALMRTHTSGKSYAAQLLRERYYIKSSDFKHYTQSKSKVDEGGLTIRFRGRHIPLLSFDTKIGKDGRVSSRVKRSSTQTIIEHAFVSTVGNKAKHEGVFERETSERLPIKELFGPSAPQMMSANQDIKDDVAKHIKETFENRLDHEISAILNGWR